MIKLIAIVDQEFGIAKNQKIPWQFEQDLKFFAEKTINNVVVMGRTTFENIVNAPLKYRTNCVLSRSLKHIPGAEVFSSIDSVIAKYNNIWVIGGAKTYNEFLRRNLVEYALITQVHKQYDADLAIDKQLLSHFSKKTLQKNKKYSILEFYNKK